MTFSVLYLQAYLVVEQLLAWVGIATGSGYGVRGSLDKNGSNVPSLQNECFIQ